MPDNLIINPQNGFKFDEFINIDKVITSGGGNTLVKVEASKFIVLAILHKHKCRSSKR